MSPSPTAPAGRTLAWLVHLLTASGAVWALLALRAAATGDYRASLGWMALAVAVDAVDGPLARTLRVAEALPHVNGALLDNIVDYSTYVLAPAFLILQAGLLPDGYGLAGAAAICIASAFQFSHVGAKSADHYFRGFPCYWNVVALYLLALRPPAWISLLVVGVLCLLVFAPVRCVYPSRTHLLRRTTLALTGIWAACVVAILIRYPDPPALLVYASLAYPLYYAVLSLYSSASRASPRPHSATR